MPEIIYKRGLDNNYLVIKGDDNTIKNLQNNYKIKMMAENRIDHLLKLEMKMCDGIYDYYYEISGKQPIGRIFDHKDIKTDNLINMITSIDEAYEKAYEYMLPPEHFVIEPKLMYMDLENSKIDFLYYPEYERPAKDALMELAEYVLDKVDHQDTKAVMIAYQFYKIVRTGNFTRKELIKIIEENHASLTKEYNNSAFPYGVSDNNYLTKTNNKDENKNQLVIDENIDKYDAFNINTSADEVKKSKFSFAALLSFGKNKKNKAVLELEEDEFEFATKKENDNNYQEFHKENRDVDNDYEDIEQNTICENNISETELYGKTMILISEEDSSSHILIQKGKTKDIIHELKDFPLSLGKVSDIADIVLKDPSVSKLHAEIFQVEDKILIKDCNSTNGTYVNGLQLDAEESIDLEPGDEIRLGKVKLEYR